MSAKEKENVICPVCSNFEPQTWRKNLCKNCFHELHEHSNDSDATDNKTTDANVDKNKAGSDKEKRKSIIDESDQKKLSTDERDKSDSKKASPETPAKKSPSTFSKVNENVTQKSKESQDQKQKSPSPLQKIPVGKSDSQKSEPKASDNFSQSLGVKGKENVDQKQKQPTPKTPGKLDLTKSTFDKMSQGTSNVASRDDGKKQTTSKDTADTKLGQKFETDKKASSANLSPKPKTNDNKQTLDTDTQRIKSLDDNKPENKSDRDSKFKKDDRKVKQFAKSFSFSSGEDAEDARFNSLDRKKVKDKPNTPTTPPLTSSATEGKAGIKCQLQGKDETISQSATGSTRDKISSGSSAINKNASGGLTDRKNVDLGKIKDSGTEKDISNKTSGLFGKDKSEKDKEKVGLFGKDKSEKEKGKDSVTEKTGLFGKDKAEKEKGKDLVTEKTGLFGKDKAEKEKGKDLGTEKTGLFGKPKSETEKGKDLGTEKTGLFGKPKSETEKGKDLGTEKTGLFGKDKTEKEKGKNLVTEKTGLFGNDKTEKEKGKDVGTEKTGLFGKPKSEKDKGKDLGAEKNGLLGKDKSEKAKEGSSEKIGRNIDKIHNKADNNKNFWKLPSKGGTYSKEENERSKRDSLSDVELSEDATKIDLEFEKLKTQLAEMEKKCTTLEEENLKLKHGLSEKEQHESQMKLQKSDVENSIKSLQNQLASMETRCCKLDTDNTNLIDKLKHQQEEQGKMSSQMNAGEMKQMEDDVQESENICQSLNEENDILKQEIQDLKSEMDEMYDNFRDQEAEEFRELQRDLEVTAKNCRVLQFKLRKAERKSEQVEKDRDHYEEKLKMLQSSFNSEDARSHIETLEEELRMAKEVSVRLHDQLDLLEDKGSKMDEENQHLTRLLEMSDKKQFRLEMEIDKLRDQIMDMRDKMKDKSQPTTPSDEITDRKELLGRIGKQGSQELDSTQLIRDLYDSMEREKDLKDQLTFAEEEAKSMRKKLEEFEEENENLSVQLKRMSVAQATKPDDENNDQHHEITQAEVEMKLHIELNEQELAVCKKKIHDFVNDNEKLKEEITRLKADINRKDQQLQIMPEPSSPNAYYEDKIRELKEEADELRWKSIEKEREIERLFSQVNTFQSKHTSKLKRSSSLDSDDYHRLIDLKRQFEVLNQEKCVLEEKLAKALRQNEILDNANTELRHQDRHIASEKSISDEDLAVIFDLQSKVSNLEKENQTLIDHINKAADDVHSLPLISRSKVSGELEIQADDSTSHDQSRDLLHQLNTLQQEACTLRTQVIELEDKNKQLSETLVTYTANTLSPADDSSVVAGGSSQAEDAAKGESREELMDRLLDLEEENETLYTDVKKKNEEITRLLQEVNDFRDSLEDTKNEFRKKELNILDDLDLAQDKNDILSNLLDIVKERAETAEQELERIAAEQTSRSASVRSARLVSALSDASAGSDEVFDGSSSIPSSPETQGKSERRQVIHKDWENQFRKRIDCLERLLAEERQKLTAAEKKLTLMSTETLSTAMSDDVKLHHREKELLQAELLEEQKHLKIANDQIIGLKERILTLEEENQRLKTQESESQEDDVDTCIETPSGSIDSVLTVEEYQTWRAKEEEIKRLAEECERYKSNAMDLEQKLDKVNEEWEEKTSETEREKEKLRDELDELSLNFTSLNEKYEKLKNDNEKNKELLRERESSVHDKSKVVDRKEELIQEQEEIIRQREEDLQALLDQISHRDDTIKTLRDLVRNRDERLKEKDDLLRELREGFDEKQEEIHFLHEEMDKMGSSLKDKDDVISDQENKLAEYTEEQQTNIQTENIRLKGDLESIVGNLEQMHTDKGTLQTELDKAKHALSEAMVLWDKDRSSLGSELAVAREKISLLEATTNKKDSQIVATLRKETHRLLDEKGRLANEARVHRIEGEANIRTLRYEKMKLQEELTQKIRQLTAEMTQNDQMTNELDRLRAQEEIAYQIQHHEKVLRAEYLAMKVRYETRLENLQKDHLTLLTNLDQLQREKVLDKDIIKGVQKGMSQMKQAYANDLTRIKEEKEMLEKHMRQIDEGRTLATELQKKVDELKCQIADQEYERAEILNRITTERSGWEVDKANMQSKINELSEKLAMVTQAQCRTKDMQTRMEVAWNTERSEQKRLLSEAHSLALDLQRQLRSRDEEYVRERRALIEQLKKLRTELDDEMQLRHSIAGKIGGKDKDFAALEKKLKDVEDRAEKEQESSLKDRADLARRLGEMRKQHKRDQRRIEDVLAGLTRLRELASIVVESENEEGTSDKELTNRLALLSNRNSIQESGAASSEEGEATMADLKQSIDDVVLKYIKEALKEIHFAVEDMARPREISDDEKKKLRRSLSSSELDMLKDEFLLGKFDGCSTPTTSVSGTQTDPSVIKLYRSITCNGTGDLQDKAQSSLLPDIHYGSVTERQQSIMQNIHNEQGVKVKFPEPPPSFLLPRCQNTVRTKETVTQATSGGNTREVTTIIQTTETTTKNKRNIPKSISIDTSLLKTSFPSPDSRSAFSAGATPTENFSILSSIPLTQSDTSCDTSSTFVPSPHSGSSEHLTPRSARKQFFESQLSDSTSGYMSWPERGSSRENIKHVKQTSLPDPNAIMEAVERSRYKSDEPITTTSSESIGQSELNTTQESTTSNEEREAHSGVTSSSSTDSVSGSHKPTKTKRKLFKSKRSVSADSSTVRNYLAKAGARAISAGAPSNLSPGDFFAAVKNKFKHSKKTTPSSAEKETTSKSDPAIHTHAVDQQPGDSVATPSTSADQSVTESSFTPMRNTYVPPPTPPISEMRKRLLPEISQAGSTSTKYYTPKRSFEPAAGKPQKRKRSRSAERAVAGPSSLRQPRINEDDVIIPFQAHLSRSFSETTV